MWIKQLGLQQWRIDSKGQGLPLVDTTWKVSSQGWSFGEIFLARELLTCGMHYPTAPRAQKQYKNSRTC